MNADRTPLFCDTALAERIERVEARFMAECCDAARRRDADSAGFVCSLAGGVAGFAEEGSPYSKGAGLGSHGVPSADDLNEVDKAFAANGAAVQIELAHLADPAIGVPLTGRGYRLESFENVLDLALDGEYEPVASPGMVVRPSGDEFERWLDVVADGAAHPDTQGLPLARGVPSRDLPAGPTPCRGGRREALHRRARRCLRRWGRPASVGGHRTVHPVRRPHPRTAAAASRPLCCRPGSPTPRPRAATSPSSRPSRGPSRSRTPSARVSICSTPEPCW